MVSPMAQLRRAGRAHELSCRLKLAEDTSADGGTAQVAEDVDLLVASGTSKLSDAAS